MTGSIQPARAVYRCEEGRTLTVEATQNTVAVMDGDERIVLAAAPPGQTSRFSEGPDVLVAEGGEALWMRAGETPLNCVR